MKQLIKYTTLITIALMLFTSCEQTLEEINLDPNKVTSIDDGYLFSKAVQLTFGGDQNERKLQFFFGSQYSHYYVVRHNTGRPHDKYMDFLYTDDYYYVMTNTFTSGLKHSNKVVSMTSPSGSDNKLRNALAKVVSIVSYTRITDLYGDVPYSEGGWGDIGKLTPKYDPQEFIYKSMMDTLKWCYETIKSSNPADGYDIFDPLYDNHLEYWAKFANSMRLRLAMRARFAAPDYCENVIQECLQEDLIETNEENARLFSLNDNRNYNQWSSTWDLMPWKMSSYIVDSLKRWQDPRLYYWIEPTPDGKYIGVSNGINDNLFGSVKWDTISDPAKALRAPDMPVHYLTAAEVSLNKAETEVIFGGSKANEYFQKAIVQAMTLWKIPLDTINNYIQRSPQATLYNTDDTEMKLRKIGNQKWLTLVTNFTEAYSEMRRLGYPEIPQRKKSEGLDIGVTNGYLPKRFLYPPEEISLNERNALEAIERQGPNLISTPVWWDVKGD